MKILVSGDFCPIGRTERFLNEENYEGLFNGFENISKTVDYSIVNFECPLTVSNFKRVKTGPCIKTENLNSLKALEYAGFNLLTLANNHIQDYSEQGVLDTIKNGKEAGFDIVGAGKNIFEASTPLIKEICGIKVGFINIAENEFCAATEKTAGANTFDFIENTKSIQNLKTRVDKIVLIYHGGREHYQLPTPEQRRRLRYFIDCGVDAIVAHHTHCVSGYEYYREKPIVYSLGNFIFDYKEKYQKGLWTEGMSVILELKNTGEHFRIELVPHKQGQKKNSTLEILKSEEKEAFLQKIGVINTQIVDDNLFLEMWSSYLKTQERFYLSSLYIRNFFLRAFFIKGLLPLSLLRGKHNILSLNLIRCETHQEISREVLMKHFGRK